VDDGIAIASLSGNTTKVGTISGSLTSGNLIKSDASGNLIDAGVASGGKTMLTAMKSDPSTSATRYMGVSGESNSGFTSEAKLQDVVSIAGTFKNLYCSVKTAPGVGKSWAFTLRKNGAASSVTCMISGTSTTCTDSSNTSTAVAGDLFAVQIVPTSNPAASDALSCGLEYDAS